MNGSDILKRHWRLILNIGAIASLIILAYAIRFQLVDTLNNLTKVRAWVLLLIVPIEALNYHAQAKLYQKLFTIIGEKLSYINLLKLAIELNFVNQVFPSGGVSGISYFGFRLQESKVKGTKSTLVQTMKLMLLFVSFEPILIVGMLVLVASGKANDLVLSIGSALTMLVVIGTALFVYVIGNQERINSFLTPLVIFLNQSIHFIRPKRRETINVANAKVIFDDFYENYALLRAHYTELLKPFCWSLVANISEIAVIYVVYVAFGSYINVGAIVLAYAVANFAGLISLLPGGAGVYEVLMTAVLVAAGIPARLSLPVTVMYRVLNTLLQVPPGYILYRRTLAREPKIKVEINHV